MITTVCLNPAIDRSVTVGNLRLDAFNLADSSRSDLGGKAVNVSVALRNLGVPVRCVGFDFDGEPVRRALESQQIPFEGIAVPGSLRVNLKLHDPQAGTMTEINERGAAVPAEAPEQLTGLLDDLLAKTRILVLSGSVPPGVPESIYARLTEQAREAGVPTLLDAAGPALRDGLKARPWMVKPNRYELETLLGKPLNSRERVLDALQTLLDGGTENVCLSMGGDGAYLATADGVWHSAGMEIPVQGRQGAGDSMVAGLCMAALDHLAPSERLRCAMAAAHASLLREGTLLCLREDYLRLVKEMPVEKLV